MRRVAPPKTAGGYGDFYLRVGKRTFDILIALHLLVFAGPVMLVLTVLCALDGGSPLYRHQRVGLRGRKFQCLKFRTMRVDSAEALLDTDRAAAAEWAVNRKLERDPRITPLGRFLRRTSLDELPQLFNILRGDMSVVGPRPITEEELIRYEDHTPKYLSLRPGLTGLWQVHGRGRVGYRERVEMDAQYYWTASFAGDLRLMAETPLVMLQRRGE
jgi:undecaprenyl-phosphate galactose phosphotransferase